MTNYEYVVQADTNGIPINSIGRDSMSKICADRFAIDGMRKRMKERMSCKCSQRLIHIESELSPKIGMRIETTS